LIMLSRLDYLYKMEREEHKDTSEEVKDYGWSDKEIIDCKYGCNPYGCSPSAIKVFQDKAKEYDFTYYPEPTGKRLKENLALYWETQGVMVKPEDIVVGEGAIGILERLNKMLLFPGARVLGYLPQWQEYISEARSSGAFYSGVSLHRKDGYKFSVNTLIKEIKPEYKLIYVDNPNNPTGQLISLSDINTIIERAAETEIPVIIDEAYGDFVSPESSAINLYSRYPNLIVVRSFSKGFGLPGLRVGYAFLHGELRRLYSRVDLPFRVLDISTDVALTSLKDKKFILDSSRKIKKNKEKIINRVKILKIGVTDLCVPIMVFLLPDFVEDDIDLMDIFLRHGILVRPDIEDGVRLRVPPREKIGVLLERLGEIEEELE
jgi:histidinol-phosphate aminotransferase